MFGLRTDSLIKYKPVLSFVTYVGKDCSSFLTVGIFATRCWMNSGRHPTGLLPGVSRSTSGAIHPSVPGIPDRKEKLLRPSGIFLQSPKSEMRARTWPRALGPERRMFLGLRSRWTAWRDDGEGRRMFLGWWTVGKRGGGGDWENSLFFSSPS